MKRQTVATISSQLISKLCISSAKIFITLATISIAIVSAHAGELPPTGSKPLSLILKTIEEQKIGRFADIEFDDGLWEITVCENDACQKLYITPSTAEEKRRRKTDTDEIPSVNATPLSAILPSIEASGQGVITEIKFEHDYWKMQLRKDGKKTELAIDAMTGKVRS